MYPSRNNCLLILFHGCRCVCLMTSDKCFWILNPDNIRQIDDVGSMLLNLESRQNTADSSQIMILFIVHNHAQFVALLKIPFYAPLPTRNFGTRWHYWKLAARCVEISCPLIYFKWRLKNTNTVKCAFELLCFVSINISVQHYQNRMKIIKKQNRDKNLWWIRDNLMLLTSRDDLCKNIPMKLEAISRLCSFYSSNELAKWIVRLVIEILIIILISD